VAVETVAVGLLDAALEGVAVQDSPCGGAWIMG